MPIWPRPSWSAAAACAVGALRVLEPCGLSAAKRLRSVAGGTRRLPRRDATNSSLRHASRTAALVVYAPQPGRAVQNKVVVRRSGRAGSRAPQWQSCAAVAASWSDASAEDVRHVRDRGRRRRFGRQDGAGPARARAHPAAGRPRRPRLRRGDASRRARRGRARTLGGQRGVGRARLSRARHRVRVQRRAQAARRRAPGRVETCPSVLVLCYGLAGQTTGAPTRPK